MAEQTKFVEVCHVDKISKGLIRRCVIDGREIALFYINGTVYALDEPCFHAGGPISQGDIEDIGGHTCVVCPWHMYAIDVCTGEHIKKVWRRTQEQTDNGQSLGLMQRTHKVKIQNDIVYVAVCNEKNTDVTVESDKYWKEGQSGFTF